MIFIFFCGRLFLLVAWRNTPCCFTFSKSAKTTKKHRPTSALTFFTNPCTDLRGRDFYSQSKKKTAPLLMLPYMFANKQTLQYYFKVVVQVTFVPQSHCPLLIAQHLLYGDEVILVQAKSPDWFHLEAQSSADLLGSILVKMMFL